MTRLWPGTKILALFCLTTAVVLRPRWPVLAAFALVLVLGTWLGRVPLSARPRVPGWIVFALVGGGIGSALGGGLEYYVRSLALGLLVLWGAALLVWTSPPEQLVPAVARLISPLRLVRVPTQEWARVMVLVLRGLPVLTSELQATGDASRLRGSVQTRLAGGGGAWRSTRAAYAEGIDVLIAAVSAADRRAAATGRAMTLRGGVPEVARVSWRLGWADVVLLVASVAALACAIVI